MCALDAGTAPLFSCRRYHSHHRWQCRYRWCGAVWQPASAAPLPVLYMQYYRDAVHQQWPERSRQSATFWDAAVYRHSHLWCLLQWHPRHGMYPWWCFLNTHCVFGMVEFGDLNTFSLGCCNKWSPPCTVCMIKFKIWQKIFSIVIYRLLKGSEFELLLFSSLWVWGRTKWDKQQENRTN